MAEDLIDAVELLRQRPGDADAIGRVWERYRSRLLRVVRLRMDHRLQGRIDASDVLQEAFVDFAGPSG
jgi:RNA polymerase sigma-70 factor, ECF subfamily